MFYRIVFCLVVSLCWSLSTRVGAKDTGVGPETCGDPNRSAGQEQSPQLIDRSLEDNRFSSDRIAARIGQKIFLDSRLSRPVGQACISCHSPTTAFADARPVSPGAVKGRMGKRNAPSLMYAALIPGFAYEDLFTKDGTEIYAYEGGLFHDGRARDLFEQVQQPFFDRNEMNLRDRAELAARLRDATYATEFKHWIGRERWDNDSQLTYHAFRALVSQGANVSTV